MLMLLLLLLVYAHAPAPALVPMVAPKLSWDELFKLAAAEILNLDISPLVLKRFGLTERAFEDLAERPKTWVDLAVLQVVGEQDLVAERLESACHAAAHLNLLLDNSFRTPWMAAKLLFHQRGPCARCNQVPSEAPCDNQARKHNLL